MLRIPHAARNINYKSSWKALIVILINYYINLVLLILIYFRIFSLVLLLIIN